MLLSNADIHIRDPFVVVVPDERRYVMTGTTGENAWSGQPTGFNVYVSDNLEQWEGPIPAFRPAPGFWSDRNYWAPEIHAYRGRYYMFASFKAEGVCRGTQILSADSPRGPFQPHSARPLTPSDWECLDGTLHVDADGNPWMVFCHEWVQVHDGEICALRLSDDLSSVAGDPITLFRASEAPWITPIEGQTDFVTDGPFLYRAQNGELLMLWSSFSNGGYTLGVARSASGTVTGPWHQDAIPLYAEDGGHGMLFHTFDPQGMQSHGQLMLTLHRPNKSPDERPIFIPIGESDGVLKVLC